MARRIFILMTAAAVMPVLFAGEAPGAVIRIESYQGPGHFIGGHIAYGGCVPPVCRPPVKVVHRERQIVVRGPHRSRFIRIRPYRRPVVVVNPPYVREVLVKPAPKVIHHAPAAQQTRITVWITNSNGSKTSVNLTRSGPGYLGPKGEWYANMPSEKQLRMVYGF